MVEDRKTKIIEGVDFNSADFNSIVETGTPCVLKGALSQSPLVLAGQQSDNCAMEYLLSFASERRFLSYSTNESPAGRFFYNSTMSGFNFTTGYHSLAVFFEKLQSEKKSGSGAAFYVGSAELAEHFPGLIENESLVLNGSSFKAHPPRVGVWLGNRTTAATHYDVSNNVAACLVGRRRFTLFPPEQIVNLYPGPLEPTPGGQVVSLFDLNAPDYDRFPRAKQAMANAEIAELEPGDVLVYPAMWWHQVEALEDFNVMVNFWWNLVPDFVDDPMGTLLSGMLTLRERPEHERKAWKALFDFYIFGDPSVAREHIPEHSQGPLGALDDVLSRKLRMKLLKKLNR